MSNKTNHPQKYVFWRDWDAWLIKEWFPFKQKILENDLPHMKADIVGILRDIMWLKLLSIGIIVTIIGSALAIILTR